MRHSGAMGPTRRLAAVALLLAAFTAVLLWSSHPRDGTLREAPRPEPAAATDPSSPPLLGAAPGAKPTPRTPEVVPFADGKDAWRVEGRVVDEHGDGVAGATVQATLRRGEVESAFPTMSSKEGGYAIDLETARRLGLIALEEATLSVRAWAAGYAPSATSDLPCGREPLDGPRVTRVDLTLPAGDALWGRVLRKDGSFVVGADVSTCSGKGERGSEGARTGPDGQYVIARPGSSGWILVAFSQADGVGRAPIELAPDARKMRDVVLEATPQVEGTIVYADGAPVAAADLWAEPLPVAGAEPGDPCLSGWVQGHAGSAHDGTFRILLPREGPCRVREHSAGAEATCHTGDRDVRLVVTKHRLRIRVVDADGNVIPGHGLLATGWSAEHAATLDAVLRGEQDVEEARQHADSVSAGSVRDVFAGAGSAWLFVTNAKGALPAEASARVPATGNESEVSLVLKPLPGGGRVHVQAQAPDGATLPLLHASVTTLLGSYVWNGALPADGVIGPLPPGTLRIELRPTRSRDENGLFPPLDSWLMPTTARVDLKEGAITEVPARLPRGGRIRLNLRTPPATVEAPTVPYHVGKYSASAMPVLGGESVRLMTYDDVPGHPPTWISSAFDPGHPQMSATLLPPADYRIEVTGGGRSPKSVVSGPVSVRAGEVADVALDAPSEK